MISRFIGASILRRMIRTTAIPLVLVLILAPVTTLSLSASPAFDLLGPQIKMTVTRDGKTLPISRVNDLQPGDKLWIHPDFPSDQSARYLLVVAFLQGSTNPPPENWFTRAETWDRHTREKGITILIPPGAEQAVMFLAPETGGDFATLRSTVRGRPGLFVRASADLEQASLDRTRLDKYLDDIQRTSELDPTALKKRSALLAQTLRIKLNEDCFSKPLEQQSSCLTQNTDDLVINDEPGQNLVATLTSGPSSDLITALGTSPAASKMAFSPYVGAVVDAARLLNNLHTATYQFIPALGLPEKDRLNLKLNSPPSFHNPKSVIVIGLPPVSSKLLPSLQNISPKRIFCLQQSPLILPVEGTPLVFSTEIAHDFVFRVEGKGVAPIELPAAADAVRGGFIIDTRSLHAANLGPKLTGTLRGVWGFSSFEGPSFQLHNAHPGDWTIHAQDEDSIVVGHDSTVQLKSDCVACVEKVALVNASGKDLKTTWKAVESDQLEIELPLKNEHFGHLELKVAQFGLTNADIVTIPTYSEPAHLDHFLIHAADQEGILSGTHLDEVSCLELNGVCFQPAPASASEAHDRTNKSLLLIAENPAALASLLPNSSFSARVTLQDGRVLTVAATLAPPRPKVALLSKNLQPASTPSPVRISNPGELPQNGRLSFFLKSEIPATFPLSEKIEVATTDGSFATTLSVSEGNLVLQDAASALALFDPLKAFGPAAFGPLHFRAIDVDGAKGDWQPCAILVRIPTLTEIRCPDSADKPCVLHGSNLFLLDSVSADPNFRNPVAVPAGYVEDTLIVPRPSGTLLYLKLRDDSATIDTAFLPVLPDRP